MDADGAWLARSRRREPWPLAIAALLLAMAGVLVAFLWISLARPDPLLVSDAWAASGRYDAARRAAQRAAALGLRLDLALTPAPGGTRAAVRLRDADGRPLAAERVRLRRVRPTQGGLDADFEATRTGDAWVAFVPLPREGRWILEASAHSGDETIAQQIAVEAGR